MDTAADLPPGFTPLAPLRQAGDRSVWLAERDGRRVVLRVDRGGGRDVLAELDVLAAVHHPGIAPLLDFGEAPGGGWFVARPWIEGIDLHEWATSRTPEEIGAVAVELCAALQAVHAAGFVHGDVTPENVVLGADDGRAYLCDFGLAGRASAQATATGGTSFSLSPEDLLGEPRSDRTDLFALGVLLLRTIRPFEVRARDFYAEFPRRSFLEAAGVRPEELPAWSRDLVVALVHRDPHRRPASAAAVARTLASRLGITGRPLEERVELRWPPLFGREAWWREWWAAARDAPAGASGWIRVPDRESPRRLVEELRIRASLAGVPTLVREAPDALTGAGTTDALDRWAADVLAGGAPSVWIVPGEDREWSTRALAHLLRRRELLAERGSDAPFVAVVAGFDPPSDAGELVHGDVPPVAHADVVGFLASRLEATEPERIETAATALAAAADGSATRLQRALDDACRSEWFVLGAEEPRLRPGELPPLEPTVAGVELDEGERILLASLVVCGGRAPLDEVAAVSGLDGATAGAAVANASRRRLLAVADLGTGQRLELRARATELAPAPVWRALHARRRDGVEGEPEARAAHDWASDPSPRTRDAIDELVAELCERGQPERALALLERIDRFRADVDANEDDVPLVDVLRARCWSEMGLLENAEAALARAGDDGGRARARVELVRARIAARRHDTDGALAHLEVAERLDPALAAEALAVRAQHLFQRGRDRDVRTLVADLADGASRPPVSARRRAFLEGLDAMSALRLGDVAEARRTTRALVSAAHKDGDARREAALRLNLATIERRTGSREEALRELETARELFRRAGDLAGVATVAATAGGVLREAGRLLEAEPHLATAVDLRERLGDTKGVVLVRGLVGLLAFERGHAHAAVEELGRARRDLSGGDKLRTGPLLEALEAEMRARLGTGDAGLAAIPDETSDPRALVSWAKVAWIGGQRERAAQLLERARTAAASLGQRPLVAQIEVLVLALAGDFGRIRDDDEDDDARVLRLLHEDVTGERLSALADSLARAGRDDRAARLYLALATRSPDDELRDEARRRADELVSACGRGTSRAELDRLRSHLLGIPDPWPADLSEPAEAVRGIPMSKVLALLDINRKLVREDDLPSLLSSIVEQAIGLCRAERGFLILEEEGTLRFDTALESRRGIAAPELEVSSSIVQEALERMETLRVSNAVDDPSYGRLASVASLDLRSVLCVPFAVSDELRGALYLDNRLRTGAFDEENEHVVRLLADQAALAIVQLRRTDELRRLYAQLQRKVIDQAEDLTAAREELRTRRLREEPPLLVGESEPMRRVRTLVEKASKADLPVLVLGASGTGKDLVARSLHRLGSRSDGPYVSENCAAIPETLFEAELFGHKKGAFTGADTDRKGLFERAHGGTFFLDEAGELPEAIQVKLLRVLETRCVRPVGSSEEIPVDVRLVAATNRDLEREVEAGRFRQDLFYRLEGLRIELPTLDERTEDIPALVEHFLEKDRERTGVRRRVSRRVLEALARRPWPGNVRELASEVARLCLASEGTIDDVELVRAPTLRTASVASSPRTLAEIERRAILDAIDRCGGNKVAAARQLGISRAKVYQKLKEWRAGAGEASRTSGETASSALARSEVDWADPDSAGG